MTNGLECQMQRANQNGLVRREQKRAMLQRIIEQVDDDIPVQTPSTGGVFKSGTGRTKLEHSGSISGKSPYV